MLVADHVPLVRVPTLVRLELRTPVPRPAAPITAVPSTENTLPAAKFKCSLEVQLGPALLYKKECSLVPVTKIPAPLAEISVEVAVSQSYCGF